MKNKTTEDRVSVSLTFALCSTEVCSIAGCEETSDIGMVVPE